MVHLLSFSDALLANILSFNDAADLFQILECENSILTNATQLALSNAPSLHLSFLLQLDQCRNHGSNSSSNKTDKDKNGQEKCIEKLLNVIPKEQEHKDDTAQNSYKLQRIELSGLRHVAGDQGDWLSRIFGQFSTTLTSIDFSGCALLDPRKLHEAIVPRRTDVLSNSDSDSSNASTISCSIRHLNFQGCYRVDSGIVLAIAKSPRFRQLEHLGLGGCSQSIANECVLAIVQNLKQLRSLDLSGLKRITDAASEVFLHLPNTLENLELAGCDLVRFSWLSGWGLSLVRHIQQQQQQSNNGQQRRIDMSSVPVNFWQELHRNDKKEPRALDNWVKMNFSGIGTPRRGLVEGALPYLALRSMGSLREVYLSGCEQVHDWEIEVLSSVCANSLTCLEMRACCVGDDAIRAVGAHCTNIADLDFSACFRITDEGVVAFCQYQGVYDEYIRNKATRFSGTRSCCTVRSLKLAALPELTDKGILAVSALDTLLVLDVHNCPKVTSEALSETLSDLVSLVELEAKGIGQWGSSIVLPKGLQDGEMPTSRLRFINGRSCNKSTSTCSNNICYAQCSVRQQSKRLLPSQGVPLQPMFHCIDCKLTPSLNRGMCHACSLHCHQGHQTFVGSYTRFYCDCPFGVAAFQDCQAIRFNSAKHISAQVIA